MVIEVLEATEVQRRNTPVQCPHCKARGVATIAISEAAGLHFYQAIPMLCCEAMAADVLIRLVGPN
jgi:hypothetical protein